MTLVCSPYSNYQLNSVERNGCDGEGRVHIHAVDGLRILLEKKSSYNGECSVVTFGGTTFLDSRYVQVDEHKVKGLCHFLAGCMETPVENCKLPVENSPSTIIPFTANRDPSCGTPNCDSCCVKHRSGD